ncbi:MAG TPA: LacI family DNA-binding transcriptional regulator [Tepidisphaeraceae bacterium]|nr:LacI family DNA-binding transcriptional regulator [Tepidisphaeraceae bacterium]
MARVGTSLVEVARRCSVSQSTVSRVLNNAKHGRFSVSPEVRARIVKTARELNYRPSIAARNLAVSKTNLVAVLGIQGFWSDRVGPLEEAINVLAEKLDREGYEICVQFMSLRHGAFELPPLRVDGVVAAGPSRPEEVQALEDADIPYVSLDGVAGKRGLQVVPDDAGGTWIAARHLYDLGHRRIAYMDHPSVAVSHPSVLNRREAFKRAAKKLGFEIPVMHLARLAPDAPWDTYYRPFLQESVVEGRATAVLSYSHYGALSLLRTAHDMGLNVPADFSLACFNNEPVLALAVPSITAVELPSVPMGQMAADLLLREMAGKTSVETRCMKLEEKLIVRESTAPPAAGRA